MTIKKKNEAEHLQGKGAGRSGGVGKDHSQKVWTKMYCGNMILCIIIKKNILLYFILNSSVEKYISL